jgi:3-oxoacyl-[acyl-carrier-protein] synthase II
VADLSQKESRVKRRKVVITGLGLVTPIGVGIDSYWANAKSGRSGIGPIISFNTSMLPVNFAGEVNPAEFDPKMYVKNRKQLKLLSRNAVFAMAAANMAIEDSNLNLHDLDPARIGVYLGTSFGQRDMEDKINVLLSSESESIPGTIDTSKYRSAFMENINPVHTLHSITNLVTCHIAIANNARGPVNTFVSSWTSGSQAIGRAYRSIVRGDSDVMISGGTEATLCPQHMLDYALFLPMSRGRKEPSEKACRPFDAMRDGLVLGEGAGIVIVESLEHAAKRGAIIYGEIIGFGLSSGHVEHDRLRSEKSIVLSMENGLSDAGLKASDVDYINANGDSTKLGDKLETLAIKEVFGEYAYEVPVSSTKSMIGHLCSASGAVELITSLLTMREDIIPPTINYDYPDGDCDLDYVPNQARPYRVNLLLSNSVGLFGESASLIVKRFHE